VCGECDLALTLHFRSQFCITRRLDCIFLEAVAGLLSMTRTAVADEVERSAVDSKYSNGSRALPWGRPLFSCSRRNMIICGVVT
jgi:hypothetical protein